MLGSWAAVQQLAELHVGHEQLLQVQRCVLCWWNGCVDSTMDLCWWNGCVDSTMDLQAAVAMAAAWLYGGVADDEIAGAADQNKAAMLRTAFGWAEHAWAVCTHMHDSCRDCVQHSDVTLQLRAHNLWYVTSSCQAQCEVCYNIVL
jgi:hypothetical protein